MSNFGYGSGSRPRAPVGSFPLIAFAGDSVTAVTIQPNTATLKANGNRGASFWVPTLTKQRVRTRQDLNFGVGGDTTTLLRARIGAVAACDADYVVVHIGTNDVIFGASEATFSTFKANLEAIWDALLNAGKVVIAIPPLVRADPLGAGGRPMVWRMTEWVREQQWTGRRNFYVVDPNPLFADFNSAAGGALPGYTFDDLHPRAAGAVMFSRPIADLLLGLLPAQNDSVVTSVADTYNAANNPTGNLFANVGFTGTGGAFINNSATVTGTMPDTWRSDLVVSGGSVASLTIAHSAPAAGPDGRPRRQIVFGGNYVGSADTVLVFRQIMTNYTDFQVGDRVVCEAEYETDAAAGPQCIAAIYAHVAMTMGGTSFVARDGHANTVADQLPAVAQDGILRTPPMLVTAQPTAVQAGFNIQLHQNGASVVNAASTVRIKGMSFRKVIA